MPDLETASVPAEGQTSAPPETGPEQTPEATAAPASGEAKTGQSATGEVSFIPKDLDLNTLPPEVRAKLEEANSQMVKGFTEKTMKLSEEKKLAEGLKQKAEYYDRLMGDQRIRALLSGQNGQAQAKQGQTQRPTDGEWEQAKLDPAMIPDLIRREKAHDDQTRQQEALVNDASAFVDEYMNATGEDGKSLRPDFGSLIKMGPEGAEVNLVNIFLSQNPMSANDPAQWNQALTDAYEKAKKFHDAIYSKGKKEALESAKKRANGSSELPTGIGGAAYTGPDPSTASDSDLIALAKRGVRVPR